MDFLSLHRYMGHPAERPKGVKDEVKQVWRAAT